MSNPFDKVLAADLDFMNGDVFSEPDLVTLKGADNTLVDFKAIIDRHQAEVVPGIAHDHKLTVYDLTISTNVLNRKPDTGGDVLIFPSQIGDDPTEHKLVNINATDGGGWRVRCR